MENESKHAHHIGNLDRMIPFMFSLGCIRAWTSVMFASPFLLGETGQNFNPNIPFDYAYALTGIAAAIGSKRIPRLQETLWCKPLALALLLAATAFCIFAPHEAMAQSNIMSFVPFALGGIGFCLALLLHSEALASLNLIRIALYLAASRFIAVPIVYLCLGMSEERTHLVILVLPCVAIACASYAYKTSQIETDIPNSPSGNFQIPWKPLILLSIYSFAYGSREAQISYGAGIHSSLSTAIAMGGFFVIILFFGNRFSLSSLFKSPLLLALCGFLLIPVESIAGTVASGYLISISNSLMTLLISLIFYDLSKKTGFPIIAYAGLAKVEQLFSIWGGQFSQLLQTSGLPITTTDAITTAVVTAMVLAGSLIALSEKEITSRWGTKAFEPGSFSDESIRNEFINKQCYTIEKTFGLSPREGEILRMIAKGMSNADIEHKLFIASGTLKAHIQHIYVKTDVHSRKELLILVENPEREADQTKSVRKRNQRTHS